MLEPDWAKPEKGCQGDLSRVRTQTGRLGDEDQEGMELKQVVRVKRMDRLIPFTKTNELADLYLYREVSKSDDVRTFETNLMFVSGQEVGFAVIPIMDRYEEKRCAIVGYGTLPMPNGDDVITVDVKPLMDGVRLGYGNLVGHLLILPYRFDVKVLEVEK